MDAFTSQDDIDRLLQKILKELERVTSQEEAKNVLKRIEVAVREMEENIPNYTFTYFGLVQKASDKLMVADLFRNHHLAEETRKHLGHYAADVKEVQVAIKALEE